MDWEYCSLVSQVSVDIIYERGHCRVNYKYDNIYTNRYEYQRKTDYNLQTWVAIGTAAVLNLVVVRFYM